MIERGADMSGWTLDDLISETILAMRASDMLIKEKDHADIFR